MTLRQWLEATDRNGSYIARELGVSRMTAHGWITGRFLPSLPKLAELERLTEGEVRAADFVRPEPSRTCQGGPSLTRES